MFVDNRVLVDRLEDVGRVQQNGNCAERSHSEEYVQLKPIDHHCHVFPIFSNLD